jgi:hypothetical protein
MGSAFSKTFIKNKMETHLLDDIVYEEKKRRYALTRMWVAIFGATVQISILSSFFWGKAIFGHYYFYIGYITFPVLILTWTFQWRYRTPKAPEGKS